MPQRKRSKFDELEKYEMSTSDTDEVVPHKHHQGDWIEASDVEDVIQELEDRIEELEQVLGTVQDAVKGI